jgi:cytochrome c peroxidase
MTRTHRIAAMLSTLAVIAAHLVLFSSLGATGEEAPKGIVRPLLAPLPSEVPTPADNLPTPAKAALGRQLFFDPRLSGADDVRCATCHDPRAAWADGLPKSPAVGGGQLGRNAPTVLNVGLQGKFLWDGRASTLEEQSLLPIESPAEMDQDLDELEEELGRVPGYVRQFQEVFGTSVTRHGISQALAAFQRTLISGRSPLDRYLDGDKQALSPEMRRGMELFIGEAGCIRCHHGPLLSDGQFYRLGVGFGDEGRAAVTGQKDERYKFRTPSLRDVALTAPYMHDGSRKTLTEVVEFYYRTAPTRAPEGLTLDIAPLLSRSYSEIPALVAFLEALTGEPREVTEPELPE